MIRIQYLSNDANGFSLIETILAVMIIIVFSIIGIHLLNHRTINTTDPSPTSSNQTNQTTSASPAVANPYAILPTAVSPSKVPECTQQLTYGSNGDPQPIQCLNDYLNITEWNALAALEPKVMTLGYSASAAQVQAAICSDANAADADSSASSSNAIEESVYQISALYYGWNFSTNPSIVLSNGTC